MLLLPVVVVMIRFDNTGEPYAEFIDGKILRTPPPPPSP